MSFRDERLERALVDVVLEFLLLDGDVDNLVNAVEIHVELRRVPCDDGNGDRLTEIVRGSDELARDVAQLASHVLGDDQRAVHRDCTHFSRSSTISLIRRAMSAGPPSSICAPSSFGGVNIRRTRKAGSPCSAGDTISISFCSACLIARSVA